MIRAALVALVNLAARLGEAAVMRWPLETEEEEE